MQTFDEFQAEARKSDRIPLGKGSSGRLSFLALGLVDEAGSVASLAKKYIRNQISTEGKNKDLISRLGDTLWYLSIIADEIGVPLSEVSDRNIKSSRHRWLESEESMFGPRSNIRTDQKESWPDYIEFKCEKLEADGLTKMKLTSSLHGPVGDDVDDNEYLPDGYRFHDVIHIAMMAKFCWSPFLRKQFGLKRKSDPQLDRVEDGAKAMFIEEAIARIVYRYIEDNNFLENTSAVDTQFLRFLKNFETTREVSWVTEKAWEGMMLDSAKIIRQLISAEKGIVVADIKNSKIDYRPLV